MPKEYKNRGGFYGYLLKVECPDGVDRYFRITSPEHAFPPLTYRGSVQYLGKTVAGDAAHKGLGIYEFKPDVSTKNGRIFDDILEGSEDHEYWK